MHNFNIFQAWAETIVNFLYPVKPHLRNQMYGLHQYIVVEYEYHVHLFSILCVLFFLCMFHVFHVRSCA